MGQLLYSARFFSSCKDNAGIEALMDTWTTPAGTVLHTSNTVPNISHAWRYFGFASEYSSQFDDYVVTSIQYDILSIKNGGGKKRTLAACALGSPDPQNFIKVADMTVTNLTTWLFSNVDRTAVENEINLSL